MQKWQLTTHYSQLTAYLLRLSREEKKKGFLHIVLISIKLNVLYCLMLTPCLCKGIRQVSEWICDNSARASETRLESQILSRLVSSDKPQRRHGPADALPLLPDQRGVVVAQAMTLFFLFSFQTDQSRPDQSRPDQIR